MRVGVVDQLPPPPTSVQASSAKGGCNLADAELRSTRKGNMVQVPEIQAAEGLDPVLSGFPIAASGKCLPSDQGCCFMGRHI